MSRRRLHQRQRHGRRALYDIEFTNGKVWKYGPTYYREEAERVLAATGNWGRVVRVTRGNRA